MKHNLILNYCSWNQNEHVIRILKKADIDIFYNSGEYFRQAIKHSNIEMLNTLLDYFQKTILRTDPENKYVAPLARQKLQKILQDAADTFNPSREIQTILDKYLPKEDSSDSEQELGDIAIPFFHKTYEKTELTKDNLKKLEILSVMENIEPKTTKNLLSLDFVEIYNQADNHDHDTTESVLSGNLNEVL